MINTIISLKCHSPTATRATARDRDAESLDSLSIIPVHAHCQATLLGRREAVSTRSLRAPVEALILQLRY